MAYKFKTIEKAVGIFIVVALLAVLSLLILIMRGKNFFVQKNSYYTYFSNGEGLSKGMAINYNGMKVGQITDLNLNKDNRIYLQFYVLKQYADRVNVDSVATFVPNPLGGGKMNISPGFVGSALLQNGAYINSSDSSNGKYLLKHQPKPTGEGLAGVINNANDALKNVTELLKQLHDPEAQGSMAKTLQQVQGVMSDVKRITGGIDKDQLNSIIMNLKATSDNLVEITKNLKHNRLIGGSQEPKDKNSLPATK